VGGELRIRSVMPVKLDPAARVAVTVLPFYGE